MPMNEDFRIRLELLSCRDLFDPDFILKIIVVVDTDYQCHRIE